MTEAETIANRRRHATEDVDAPERTLCGEPLRWDPARPRASPLRARALRIDNADPTCGRCLRVIRARHRDAE